MKESSAVEISGASKHIATELTEMLKIVLADRLVAVAIHGSAVKGDCIEGFSDFDFVVVSQGEISADDAMHLQTRIAQFDPHPFAYLQLSASVDVYSEGSMKPTLVPGATTIAYGELPDGLWHTSESLQASGQDWLHKVPELVKHDLRSWAFATSQPVRSRLLRLAMTRLLPTVRARLVDAGYDALHVWASPLSQLIEQTRFSDPSTAERLAEIVDMLRAENRADSAAAEEIFRLLVLLTSP